MIPYQELRIGNYVTAGGKLQQLMMIDARSPAIALATIDQANTTTSYAAENVHPVLLTDSLLKQCGFSYHDYFKFWQLIDGTGGTRSEMDIDPEYSVIDFMRKPLVKKVASLHQLQNIYFLLKGKELAVDTKKHEAQQVAA